jgi:hypothetical protein
MPKRRFTDEHELEIARMYKTGLSARAIARLHGIDKTAIIAALRRTGTQQRTPAERNRKYYIDAHAFDEIDTEEKAYWWGFIYADGNVHKRSLAVGLAQKDIVQLKRLKRFLRSSHPITTNDINCSNGKKYPGAQFYATDKHLADRLKELGILVGRPNFNLVTENLNKNLAHHWIRGYFDGDGSISLPERTNQAMIKICGDIDLLKWMELQFRPHAEKWSRKPKSICKHNKSNIYYLGYQGNNIAIAVRNYLYRGATIYMGRKHKIFFDLKTRPPKKRYRNEKGQFM